MCLRCKKHILLEFLSDFLPHFPFSIFSSMLFYLMTWYKEIRVLCRVLIKINLLVKNLWSTSKVSYLCIQTWRDFRTINKDKWPEESCELTCVKSSIRRQSMTSSAWLERSFFFWFYIFCFVFFFFKIYACEECSFLCKFLSSFFFVSIYNSVINVMYDLRKIKQNEKKARLNRRLFTVFFL